MIDPRWDSAMRAGWGRWPNTRFIEWVTRAPFAGTDHRGQVRVLELGCGAGAQLNFLSREGFEAFGVEGTQAGVAASQGHAPDATVWHGDLTDWEPPHGMTFHCVVDICTLQHLTRMNATAVIQKALEWLEPGGYIFSMWSAGGSDAPREGVPAPWPITATEIFDIFSDIPVRTGMESVIGLDGSNRQHWIIEGRKR